jgi:hypothetical protein
MQGVTAPAAAGAAPGVWYQCACLLPAWPACSHGYHVAAGV